MRCELFIMVVLIGSTLGAAGGCAGSTPAPMDPEPELELIESEAFHEIQPRETLFGIARHYETSVRVLLELNPGIDPKALQIGSRIRIPAGKAPVRAVKSSGKSEDRL